MKRALLTVLLLAVGLACCAPSQKKLAADAEKNPQYQYEKAKVCLQYGLLDEAMKYLNQALNLDPNHWASLALMGKAQMFKGNFAEAETVLQKCIEHDPNSSDLHNDLGTTFQGLGRRDQAEVEFKKAFALDQNYNASFNLAKSYYDQDKTDQALDYVQRSIQKYPKSVLAWNLQGVILQNKGKYDEAIASLLQALKIVPNEINVSFNLGYTYFLRGDEDKAKEILNKILPQAKSDELKNRIQDILKRIRTA